MNYKAKTIQACRQGGGLGGLQPPHVLADQLTLSQPGGTHSPHPVLQAPLNQQGPLSGQVINIVFPKKVSALE